MPSNTMLKWRASAHPSNWLIWRACSTGNNKTRLILKYNLPNPSKENFAHNEMQPAQELDTGMFITKLEQTTLHLLTSKPLQQRRAWGNVEILAYWGGGLWKKAISKRTLRVRMSARLKAAKKKDTHFSLPRVEILNFRPLLVAKPSSTIICRTL